jgi:hypothetical protein
MRLHPLPVLAVLAVCAGISLYASVQLRRLSDNLTQATTRLQIVESAVKRRESADPLVARECEEYGLGASREKPCLTTLWHLAQTPQQFHGSWVMVEGIYASGFEHTAVYPYPDLEYPSQRLNKHEALWVQLPLPNTNSRPVISVVGRFERGPAGHMGEYFGELVDAKVLSLGKPPTQLDLNQH